jgi:hypothetical protein
MFNRPESGAQSSRGTRFGRIDRKYVGRMDVRNAIFDGNHRDYRLSSTGSLLQNSGARAPEGCLGEAVRTRIG